MAIARRKRAKPAAEIALDFDFRDAFGERRRDRPRRRRAARQVHQHRALEARASSAMPSPANATAATRRRNGKGHHPASGLASRGDAHTTDGGLGGVPEQRRRERPDGDQACIPLVVIEAEPAHASASLVLGTGVCKRARGERDAGRSTAIPVDDGAGTGRGRLGERLRCHRQLRRRIAARGGRGAHRDRGPTRGWHSRDIRLGPNDGSFVFDLDPTGVRGRPGVHGARAAPAATGGTVKTAVVRRAGRAANDHFRRDGRAVAVGADGTTVFGVYDATQEPAHRGFLNRYPRDDGASTSTTRAAAFSSDPDVGASFGPWRRARRRREIRAGVQRARRGTYTVASVSIRGITIDVKEKYNTLVAATGEATKRRPPRRSSWRAPRRRRRGDDVLPATTVADRYGNALRGLLAAGA